MILPVSQFASASGLGALGFEWSSFVIQMITFILAYLVLRKWAFGPIIKILHERRDVMDKGVKLGEEMNKQKAELEKKIEDELSKARAKADSIIADAHDSAKQAIREAEEAAALKAETILKEAKEMTLQEMNRAKRELEKELSQLVVEATEVITKEKVTTAKDKELISSSLKEQVGV